MKQNSIAIIYGFPSHGGFGQEAASRYRQSAEENHCCVDYLDLAAMTFDPILWGGFQSKQPFEPDLKKAQEAIQKAEHLIFLYPLWWGAMPALLKGFIERVFLPGFAFAFSKGGHTQKLLANKTARVIVTMDSSFEEYKRDVNLAGERIIRDAILKFCGIDSVEVNYFGPVYKTDEEKRGLWLQQIHDFAMQDIQSIRSSVEENS
jgi:NAD(P)H dehydrogenase (quinone)